MAMPTVFITGTDTGAGKTILTCLLLSHLRSKGVHALGIKPFCSGSRRDAELIQGATDNEISLDEINPFYFDEAIAPWAAARIVQRRISLQMVLERIDLIRARCEMLLIEGAGGLLSPLADGVTSLDLIAATAKEVIVVCPNRLGILNHAQLTARALPSEISSQAKFMLRDVSQPDASSASNSELLSELLSPRRVVQFPHLNGNCDDLAYIKKAAGELESLLAAVSPRR